MIRRICWINQRGICPASWCWPETKFDGKSGTKNHQNNCGRNSSSRCLTSSTTRETKFDGKRERKSHQTIVDGILWVLLNELETVERIGLLIWKHVSICRTYCKRKGQKIKPTLTLLGPQKRRCSPDVLFFVHSIPFQHVHVPVCKTITIIIIQNPACPSRLSR